MKMQILTTVSVMALLLVAPAIAQNYGTAEGGAAILKGPGTFEVLRVPAIQEGLFGLEVNYLTLDGNRTADEMLGQPVYDVAGEQIASVDDIIVNATGEATMIILTDGGFLGFGESFTAYDYNLVTSRSEDGDSLIALGDEILSQGMSFSYNAAADQESTLIMPATSFRLSDILDAEAMDPLGNEVAEAENATLQDGKIEHVIFDLEEITDTENDMVAMRYTSLTKVMVEGDLDFQLSRDQTRMIEDFVRMDVSAR